MQKLLGTLALLFICFVNTAYSGPLKDCIRNFEDVRRYQSVQRLVSGRRTFTTRTEVEALAKALENEKIFTQVFEFPAGWEPQYGLVFLPISENSSSMNRQAATIKRHFGISYMYLPGFQNAEAFLRFHSNGVTHSEAIYSRRPLFLAVGDSVFGESFGSHAKLDSILEHEIVHAESMKRLVAKKNGAFHGVVSTSKVGSYSELNLDELPAYLQSMIASNRYIKEIAKRGLTETLSTNEKNGMMIEFANGFANFAVIVKQQEQNYQDLLTALKSKPASVTVKVTQDGVHIEQFYCPTTGDLLTQIIGFGPSVTTTPIEFAEKQLAIYSKLKLILESIDHPWIKKIFSAPAGSKVNMAELTFERNGFDELRHLLDETLPAIKLIVEKEF